MRSCWVSARVVPSRDLEIMQRLHFNRMVDAGQGSPAYPYPMSLGIRHLALKTGLSVATISRALRGLETVHPQTRLLVEKAAKAAGYRREPLVGAVLSSVRRANQPHFVGNLAVLDVHPPGRPQRLSFHQAILDGAKRRARELGFALDVFDLGVAGHSLAALLRMLRARNVLGLVVFHEGRAPELEDFPWEEFSVAELDHGAVSQALHCVCPDHHNTFTQALERLEQLGYRRPGLFIEQHKDARLKFKWLGTFLGYQATHPALGRVPVLSKKIITAKDLRRWNERYHPDVLIGHKDTIVPWLNAPRLGKTPTQGFFNLNWNERSVPCAGINHRPDLLGSVTVESVVAQIHRHERGIPSVPKTIMISGEWGDGPSLRRGS